MQRFDELDGFFFHVDHQRIDARAVVAIADQRRNRDGQARRRRDQRLRDTAGQHGRVANTVCRDRRKYLDHTNNRAQQPQQWRDRRNRTQRLEVTLEFMHDVPTGVLDRVLQDHAVTVTIDQARCQDLAKRRSLVQRLDLLLVQLVLLHPSPDLARQVLGNDALLLQRPESLKNDAHRNNRAQDYRQHQPAAGFDYLNHKRPDRIGKMKYTSVFRSRACQKRRRWSRSRAFGPHRLATDSKIQCTGRRGIQDLGPHASQRSTTPGLGNPQRLAYPAETTAKSGYTESDEWHSRRCQAAVVRNDDISRRMTPRVARAHAPSSPRYHRSGAGNSCPPRPAGRTTMHCRRAFDRSGAGCSTSKRTLSTSHPCPPCRVARVGKARDSPVSRLPTVSSPRMPTRRRCDRDQHAR